MGSTCRCCLSGNAVEKIFTKLEIADYEEATYSDMIAALTSYKVILSDGLPQQICCKCCKELKQAYRFQIKCKKSYHTLLNTSSKKPIVLIEKIKTLDESFDCDDKIYEPDVGDNDAEEMHCRDVKGIKQESDIQDDGYIYLEPLDDFVDQDVPAEEYEQVEQDVKVEKDIQTPETINEKPLLERPPKSIHKCPVCEEKFKYKSNFKNHMKKIHPEYEQDDYFCDLCNKAYKNGPRHIRRKHKDQNRIYKCSSCGEKFPCSRSLGLHMEVHKVNGAFKCPKCPLTFEKSSGYYKHLFVHKEKTHFCHICSKSFTYKYGLDKHLVTHSDERPHNCPVCKKTFKTIDVRNEHVRHHTDVENLDKETLAEYTEVVKTFRKQYVRKKPPKNTCNICGRVYRRASHLKDHMNKHLGILPYFCEICQKHVQSEERHKYFHKIKHVDAACPICGKVFVTKATMVAHVKTHNKEKAYKCDICESAFAQKCGLKKHLLIHNNEKNFICHFCSKAFIDKYKLTIHVRIHTQERPFPCDKCPKKFMTGNQLQTHKLRHEDVRSIQCLLCDKAFKTKNDMRTHLKVHAKIRKHPCKLCDKVFYRSDHRQRHEKYVHCMNVKNEQGETK